MQLAYIIQLIASKTVGLRPSIAGFVDMSGVVNPFNPMMVFIKTIKNEMGNGVTAKLGISGVHGEVEIFKIDKGVLKEDTRVNNRTYNPTKPLSKSNYPNPNPNFNEAAVRYDPKTISNGACPFHYQALKGA